MGSVRILPPTGGGNLVTQDKLALTIGLENLIRELQAVRAAEALEVMERLDRGAKVEPGAHRAKIKEFIRGRKPIAALVLT